jgi:hypothetical protein
METRTLGLVLVAAGALALLAGAAVLTGALDWFGRLPGDLRLQRGTTRVYLPLASMLVVSLALSLLLALARRFL